MPAPRLYRSTDADAPVLHWGGHTLVNVLKACLVDGYGDKLAAGWTMEYSNMEGTIAAFRNNPVTGTGFYMRVDGTFNNQYPQVQAYEIMTSENVGDGLVHTAGTSYSMITVSTSGTIARPWIVLATDTYVYFFCWRSGESMPATTSQSHSAGRMSLNFFIGDFESAYGTDSFNFAFLQGQEGYHNFGMASGYNYTSSSQYIARDFTGAAGRVATVNQVAPPAGFLGRAIGSSYQSPAYTPELGVLVSRVMLKGATNYSIRGFLPYAFGSLTTHPYQNNQEITIDGIDYVYVIWCTHYSVAEGAAGMLFRLTD